MLADDSSTESDSGSIELCFSDTQPEGYLALQRKCSLDGSDLRRKTRQAIDHLTLFDINAIQKDDSLHEDILKSSDIILHFLDRVCLRPYDESCIALTLFPCLVKAEFLSALFCHRSVCRSMAALAGTSPAAVAVVCWVDVLLAKLASFILVVAGGLTSQSSASCFLKSRRDEDYVYAATQLPEKWECIVDVTGSQTASPAAVRLAIRLLFAVCVMAPQLSGLRQWDRPSIPPLDIMSAVLQNVANRYINGLAILYAGLEYDDDERANFAMLIVIFCACQTAVGKDSACSQQYARIQSQTSLLNILQIAFYGDVTICGQRTVPYDNLNSAQAILVKWGNLIAWSWATWNDQRIADVECITDLTITWLYHLNSPFCTDPTLECLPAFTTRVGSMIPYEDLGFATTIVVNSSSSTLEDTQQDAAYNPDSPYLISPITVVLRKACSATAEFLRNNAGKWDASYERVVPSLCQALYTLFFYLDDELENLNIKDLVIENLSLIPPSVLTSSIRILREDSRLQIDVKMDEEITKSIEKTELILNGALFENTARRRYCLGVKCTLCFLALIWHCDLDNSFMSQPVSLLISNATTLLRQDSDRKQFIPFFGEALLTYVAITDSFMISGGQNIMEEATFWDLAIRSERTDFSIASAFAHRILAVGCRRYDPLDLAEAWNHLRDVLLVILGGRFAKDDEALALLICPGICLALGVLIRATSPAAEFFTNSPWTTSLCSELRSIIFAQHDSDVRYFVALRQQLKKIGKQFLDLVAERKLHLSTPTVKPRSQRAAKC